MIHIDDVDEVTRELVEFKYSLNNPTFKNIAYIHTRIVSLHSIKHEYIKKVKDNLYKGVSIKNITVFEAEYNYIKHKEIYEFLINTNDDSVSPCLTSFILYHHNISNTSFAFKTIKDGHNCKIVIEAIYSSMELKRQYTFNSIEHVLSM